MITEIPPTPPAVRFAQVKDEYKIHGIFPDPVYRTIRRPGIDSTEEEKEIEELIKEEGLIANRHNSRSRYSYIFNTRLKKLKEFCEGHIKTYVKEVHNPVGNDVNFYITQSWLNITLPGEWHHQHWHSNSIISGVFYVATVENDEIIFYDSNARLKDRVELHPEEPRNIWNSKAWYIPVEKNVLVLFPSWMEHNVEPNKKQTGNRISVSFNTFARGTFGSDEQSSELILK
jgi:uncharacterized protein (TIGR02466 family)